MIKGKKFCSRCGEEIKYEKANVCTRCGIRLRKPIYKKWWFWVIIVSVIVIIGIGTDEVSSNDEAPKETVESTEEKVEKPPKDEYEYVDLREMLDELEENALRAEKNYQDKKVRVRGRIAGFDSDGAYISIEPVDADEWNFDTVLCKIKNNAQREFLIGKEKGDVVTIEGKIIQIGEILGYTIKIEVIR